MAKSINKKRSKFSLTKVGTIIAFIIFVLYSLSLLFPFIWMILNSLRSVDEYNIITTFKDYTVTLTYDNKTLMDSNGRLNRQNASNNITYTLTVTKNGQSQSITLSSMVPGLYTME